MKNLFIRIILSFTLTVSILSCMFNFYTEKPPEPKQVIEAPIFQSIVLWMAWIKSIDWSKLGSGDSKWKYRYLPEPEG